MERGGGGAASLSCLLSAHTLGSHPRHVEAETLTACFVWLGGSGVLGSHSLCETRA